MKAQQLLILDLRMPRILVKALDDDCARRTCTLASPVAANVAAIALHLLVGIRHCLWVGICYSCICFARGVLSAIYRLSLLSSIVVGRSSSSSSSSSSRSVALSRPALFLLVPPTRLCACTRTLLPTLPPTTAAAAWLYLLLPSQDHLASPRSVSYEQKIIE